MWKLLRIWDYFLIVSGQFLIHLQYGWKAIFKASVVILREFEEQLLDMPFEIMLIQIVNLPQKYLC